MVLKPKRLAVYVHRLVWETFVGEIPQGLTIDHINTVRDDNRIGNLRCITQKENNNNPLTRKHNSESQKRKTLSEEHRYKISQEHKGKTRSEFGRKFKEHFGITNYENSKLYNKELMWYYRHNNTCRWE